MIYKNKYIKYKTKYLKLKHLIGGDGNVNLFHLSSQLEGDILHPTHIIFYVPFLVISGRLRDSTGQIIDNNNVPANELHWIVQNNELYEVLQNSEDSEQTDFRLIFMVNDKQFGINIFQFINTGDVQLKQLSPTNEIVNIIEGKNRTNYTIKLNNGTLIIDE